MGPLLDLANLHGHVGVRGAALVLGDEALGADNWRGGREEGEVKQCGSKIMWTVNLHFLFVKLLRRMIFWRYFICSYFCLYILDVNLRAVFIIIPILSLCFIQELLSTGKVLGFQVTCKTSYTLTKY